MTLWIKSNSQDEKLKQRVKELEFQVQQLELLKEKKTLELNRLDFELEKKEFQLSNTWSPRPSERNYLPEPVVEERVFDKKRKKDKRPSKKESFELQKRESDSRDSSSLFRRESDPRSVVGQPPSTLSSGDPRSSFRNFSSSQEDDSIIELNVGGQYFITYKSTLTAIKDTLFSAMFSGRYPLKCDSQGRVFIDRNPKPFELILDYFRTGDATKLRLFEDKILLKRELDYYAIDILPFTWNFSRSTPDINILEEGMIVSSKSKASPQSICSNESWNTGIIRISFKIVNQGTQSWSSLGVCTRYWKAKNWCGEDSYSWGMTSKKQRIHRGEIVEYGAGWESGDTVSVVLNLQRRTLSFELNYKDCGIAFKDLPSEEEFFICVSPAHDGDSYQLLPELLS